MEAMAGTYPAEFRNDVVAVARRGETRLNQIARDFDIAKATLRNWMKRANIQDGVRPGIKRAETEQMGVLKRRNRTLEQENEILRRVATYFAKQLPPK